MDLYGDLPPPGTEGETRSAVRFAMQPGANTKASAAAPHRPAPSPAYSSSASAGSKPQATPAASSSFKAVFKPRQTITKDAGPKKPAVAPSMLSSLPAAPTLAAPDSSTAAAVSTGRFVEVGSFETDDPYDPARPNDYLLFCEERLEQRRLKRLEKENERLMQERERERERLERERQEAIEKGDVQRLEASFGSRGRGRGLSNLPSWMTAGTKAPTGSEETATSVDVPSQIMARMGHEEGSGLGKHGQGITSAIEVKHEGGNRGVVSGGGRVEVPHPTLKRPRMKVVAPSCVVMLENFIDEQERDAVARARISQRCLKFGHVVECRVHRGNDERRRVFVTFGKLGNRAHLIFCMQVIVFIEDAALAIRELNGEHYGGLVIRAVFFDEERYARGDIDTEG